MLGNVRGYRRPSWSGTSDMSITSGLFFYILGWECRQQDSQIVNGWPIGTSISTFMSSVLSLIPPTPEEPMACELSSCCKWHRVEATTMWALGEMREVGIAHGFGAGLRIMKHKEARCCTFSLLQKVKYAVASDRTIPGASAARS